MSDKVKLIFELVGREWHKQPFVIVIFFNPLQQVAKMRKYYRSIDFSVSWNIFGISRTITDSRSPLVGTFVDFFRCSNCAVSTVLSVT